MNFFTPYRVNFSLAAIAVAVLAACGSSESPQSSSNLTPQGSGSVQCNDQSWYGGVTELCAGKLVYRDYVYDDYGADAGAISQSSLLNLNTRGGKSGLPTANTPGLLSPAAGDAVYPAGAESTADLVKLTLEVQGDMMVATFEMNALYEPGQTLVSLALDSDNDIATTSENLLGLRVEGADVVYSFNSGNTDTNLITGMFPLPESDSFRIWAVAAQADGTVMNVAFRGPDEQAAATGGVPDQFLPNKGNWWEDKQAVALAKKDISSFFHQVDVPAMRAGITELAEVGSGFRQRVYTSKFTAPGSTGEGMSMEGALGRDERDGTFCGQYFNFVGKYQPYGVYVPQGVSADTPASMMVLLHGCEANHASQINQPGMQKQFGDDLGRIIVAPLGRGPYGFYSDLSERDVLDVMDDANATFNIDQERVFIGGYSMGGYGSTRLAALYPDRFAGLSNWVGFTGNMFNTPLPMNPIPGLEAQFQSATGGQFPLNGQVGAAENLIDYLGNLRHIPGTHSYAALDELVQVNTGLAWAVKLGEVQAVPYEFYMHLPAEHLTLIALDEWGKEAAYVADLNRKTNPPHITFKTNEALDFPEYGIKHDKAYWLSSIKSREAGDAVLDVHSLACSNVEPQFENGQTAGNGPVPFVQTFRRSVSDVTIQTAENRLVAKLQNVATVNVDMDGSCLTAGAAYEIDSDGPVTVNFSNGTMLQLPAGISQGNL